MRQRAPASGSDARLTSCGAGPAARDGALFSVTSVARAVQEGQVRRHNASALTSRTRCLAWPACLASALMPARQDLPLRHSSPGRILSRCCRRSTTAGSRAGGLGVDASILNSSTWGTVLLGEDSGAVTDDSYRVRRRAHHLRHTMYLPPPRLSPRDSRIAPSLFVYAPPFACSLTRWVAGLWVLVDARTPSCSSARRRPCDSSANSTC